MIDVLMTTDTVGGVWTYALELAAGLVDHGIRTTLATLGDVPTPDQRRAASAIRNLRLECGPYRLEWMDDPWEDVTRAGDWLLALADELQPDVVHLNGYCHASLPFDAPVLVAAHSCVATWWRAVLREPLPARYERYQSEVANGLAAADAVVAPTAAFLDELRLIYGAPLEGAQVIHNGIDTRRYAGAGPRGRRWGSDFVLAAGRLWDPSKNLAILDQVAERVPWPVRVAGDATSPEGRWQAPTRSVDLLGRLPREALAVCMSRASILCHPPLYEPFGLVPLEAAASGCALVLSDLPTLREVWGDCALYAPADDPDRLAAEIRRLVTHPELREELASRAVSRAARFDRRETVARYAQLYADLVGGGQRQSRAEAAFDGEVPS